MDNTENTSIENSSTQNTTDSGNTADGDSVEAASKSLKIDVIATGLDNPRGLAVRKGVVYVAEAGRGGDTCIVVSPEFSACYGPTGAITRIADGVQSRVVTGLPSAAGPDGFFASGPSDIALRSSKKAYVIVQGLGGEDFVDLLGSGATGFGDLYKVNLKSGISESVAALTPFEFANNPDGRQVDSDPYGLAIDGGDVLVTDAAGNSLLRVDDDEISTEAVFPQQAAVVISPTLTIEPDSVPTSLVVVDDDEYYVGELGGGGTPVGKSRIFKVDAGKVSLYADGFTTIIDIARDREGNLYVLELFKNGEEYAFVNEDFSGALYRINKKGVRKEIVIPNLITPTGLAIDRDGTIYISNNGLLGGPGTGQVIRVRR